MRHTNTAEGMRVKLNATTTIRIRGIQFVHFALLPSFEENECFLPSAQLGDDVEVREEGKEEEEEEEEEGEEEGGGEKVSCRKSWLESGNFSQFSPNFSHNFFPIFFFFQLNFSAGY